MFVDAKKQIIKEMINRNMRCIEMWSSNGRSQSVKKINRNMRCIEIVDWSLARKPAGRINRNMRCIEIDYTGKTYPRSERLIGT